MRTVRNLYHSIPLDQRIPTHPVPMQSDHWLNGYAYFCTWVPRASTFKLLATGCYRHADASRPLPFDSRRRADSNETLPDSGRHLPSEVTAFFILLTSIAMRTLQTLYHLIPLDRRIPTHPVPTLSNRLLKCYRNLCTWVPLASTFKLLATGCYRHADASRPIPFDSPRRADSNPPCPDDVRPLVEMLFKPLYLSSLGKYFQIGGHWVLQACGRFEVYTIRFPSVSGFQRTLSWRCPTAGWNVIQTFVLEFPGQVLSNCWLLGATGMRTLRGLYHAIPLGERTPMRPLPTLADICPLRYLPFSCCWPL